MNRPWPLLSALTLLLALAARPAWGADPDPAKLGQAKELFVQGTHFFDEARYAEAREAFEASIALVPHGNTYVDLAAVELKLNDPVAALKHLRLALASPEMKPANRATAKKDYNEAYDKSGHVSVTTEQGATVSIDGHPVEGVAPFADPFDVTVGSHVFEAKLDGRSAKFEQDARPGVIARIELRMLQVSAPPPAPPTPVPTVLPTPPAAETLPETPPAPVGAPFWNTRREVGVVIAGVGVGALVASVVFNAHAQDEASKASSLRGGNATCTTNCSALENAYSGQRSATTASRWFLVGGLAGAVGGAVVFAWPSSGPKQAGVSPFFGPQTAGLQVTGEL